MILALALAASFASTPQAAAVGAVYSTPGRPVPRAVRTTIAGNYAVVFVTGGQIESEKLDNDPILLERFSFGWQPLSFLNDRCMVTQRHLPPQFERALLAGVKAGSIGWCNQMPDVDVGFVTDVAAIRVQMRGPFVPYVRVAGAFANGMWYGAGGGESIFKRGANGWKRVGGGGGAIGVDIAHAYGVPFSSMCALGIFDAKGCKH